jgi:Domain of unknown function (DUF5916)
MPRPFYSSAKLVAVTLVLMAFASSLATASPGEADGIVTAVRLNEAVNMDGLLNEKAWQRPSSYPLFQNEPNNGAGPRQPTDWWIAYDEDALYIAARMHETSADSVCSRLGRRDTWPESDWLYVNLDTFNDDRNAFSFSVNPDGVIGDSALYNDGWGDSSWDSVWDCSTRIDEHGWTVEIRIPFSQLNFPDTHSQVWGINVSRRYSRCQGREELFHLPRDGAGYMNRFPDLVGIEGISPGKKVEALVYATGTAEMLEMESENPFHDGSEFFGNAGADLKWGLSSSLTLNVSVNPDFGQVEADPAVVNLSDFETYFQERRPFFVKEANTFRFGREGLNNNVGFNFSDPMVFYSRRVGRAPTLGLDDNDYADKPTMTTILGAGKLTGKVGRTTLGAMSALTAEENADLEYGGVRTEQLVEPLTSYNAARIKHTSADGHRGIGLMGTFVNRDLASQQAVDNLVHRAAVIGIDGWTKLDSDKDWAMRGYLSGSRVSGSTGAIENLQLSSRRYYQRPDAEHVEYDPTRTDLKGWAGRVMVNKESGNWGFNSALGAISPGYEINDMGFQYRADQINAHVFGGYNWSEPKSFLRRRGVSAGWFRNWDFDGRPDAYGAGLFYDAQLTNYWWIDGMAFVNPDRNNYRATRGGPVLRMQEYKEVSLNIRTDSRRKWRVGLGGQVWESGDGSGGGRSSLDLDLNPISALRISLGVENSWQDEHIQFVANQDDELNTITSGVRHVFGRMDYQEISFPIRVDWTFSRNLTFQSFLQPLFAVGGYDEFKEFNRPGGYGFDRYGEDGGSTVVREDGDLTIDPDGAGPAEAFTISDPDFNAKYLKLNAVLRWEYRPGSTIYLVWTQDRANFDNPGDRSLGRDTGDLIQAPGDDIVMVKFTTWLDF